MSREKIIRMANQIATFFASQPEDQRVAGVAGHINSFWDPRMRAELLQIIAEGGEGILPAVMEAAQSVRAPAGAD